jgi:ribosomal protein L12E/L44/L45/RPP1/RPP2
VFDSAGKLAGVSILQMPSRDDMEGGDMSDLMSGGGMAVMILPAAEVAKATARSKELAAKGDTGEKKADEAKPAEGAAGGEKPKPQ